MSISLPAAPASDRLPTSLVLLGVFFVIAGVMHFVAPTYYVRIIPSWMPAPMALVLISGVAEIAGGVGVLIPATRVAAGWGLVALLIAVFPANIQMLLDAFTHESSLFWKIGTIARLPFQPLMIWWVVRAAIRGGA